MVLAAALMTVLRSVRSCMAGVASTAGARMMPVTSIATRVFAMNMLLLIDDRWAYRHVRQRRVEVEMKRSDASR